MAEWYDGDTKTQFADRQYRNAIGEQAMTAAIDMACRPGGGVSNGWNGVICRLGLLGMVMDVGSIIGACDFSRDQHDEQGQHCHHPDPQASLSFGIQPS